MSPEVFSLLHCFGNYDKNIYYGTLAIQNQQQKLSSSQTSTNKKLCPNNKIMTMIVQILLNKKKHSDS